MRAEGYVEGELLLGKVAAKTNLSDLVIKLRREGQGSDQDHIRIVGKVTRDGQPASSGRVGVWWQRDEFDRVNAGVERGRTVPAPRFEMLHVAVSAESSYAVNDLKIQERNPGHWYLVFEQPGHAPAITGPLKLHAGDREQTVNLVAVEGGTITGRVEHVPDSMAGQVWVVAFNENIIRRETRVAPDGTFRLSDLPPGRYGLKAGHDAYVDPHIPVLPPFGQERTPEQLAQWRKKAEPWQGTVEATVRSGETTSEVVLDFRPPGPLVEH